MKRILLLAISLTTLFSFGQKKDGLFLDFNVGARFLGERSELVTMKPGFHLDGGVGYMFNDIIGVKGQLGMDWFKTVNNSNEAQIDRSGMGRASLVAVISITELAELKNSDFELKAELGGGIASINNPSWKEDRTSNGVEFNDPFIKGNDDMFHFIVGLNPQYHLDRNWTLNAHVSYIGLIKQDHTLDRFNYVDASGLTSVMNVSVGVNYRFGKNLSFSRVR
ncbi:MAG: hypothetical protein EP305_06860 [Bacteroidetes bacterium]|nr:MAG: hypothetical protein EP305_06860 [Bacteroidota bacterium]